VWYCLDMTSGNRTAPHTGASAVQPIAVTLDVAAQITSLSRDTLERAVKTGHLPVCRPSPRRVVVRLTDLNTYLATTSKESRP
jgi:excisionase family DNA binding protein